MFSPTNVFRYTVYGVGKELNIYKKEWSGYNSQAVYGAMKVAHSNRV